VLNHHRLAPAGGQPIGEQPRVDVDAAARTERQDEAHAALWPGLGLGWWRVQRRRAQQDGDEAHPSLHVMHVILQLTNTVMDFQPTSCRTPTTPRSFSIRLEMIGQNRRTSASVAIEPTSGFDQNTRRSPSAPIMARRKESSARLPSTSAKVSGASG